MKLKALTMIAFALILTASAARADVYVVDHGVRSQVATDTAVGEVTLISAEDGKIVCITIRLSETRVWEVKDGSYPDLEEFREFLEKAKSEGDLVTLEVKGGNLTKAHRGSEPKPE